MVGWAQRVRHATLVVVVLALAGAVSAQPPGKPIDGRDAIVLLDAVTAANASPPVAWVGNATIITLEVCVAAGTCTDLSAFPEARLSDAGAWSPLPVAGGNADIRETDVPVGECRSWSIPAGQRWFRIRPATVTACTVSARLFLMP